MKILFGREHFSAGLPWQGLAPLLPEHEIIACSQADIARHISDADIVVPFSARVDRSLIEQGHFGLIQQFGVGLDTVDIEAATEAGVWVARLPAGNTRNADSVAELAIMFMLMLSRRLPELRTAWQEGRWAEPPGFALTDKTACILGLGDIGMALARRLQAFGMKLLAVRNNPEREVLGIPSLKQVFGPKELITALHEADYTIACIRYTPETHHLLNAEAFEAMKPGSFFINVARGGLVDHEALFAALQSGHLAGAGLDVFWEEPVALTHQLFQQNVVVTPHIAGLTDAFYHQGALVFAKNIGRYVRGELPLYTANQIAHCRSSRR
ncbi:hydroxyacid dehydrogenase [Ktedonosporobacter rubrisoli]|uniref:Hydroxyacid dehydrogenase n=1 Tax=Ktedonosporobacter rubrisoli TaxID=2509675 RepID=A0A4P6JZT2_KTERU|nr:2-hydroxyacid dehydrogenase [Ktedonosporobacter rubrisoli]QBD81418.1 hydroxyacid dehydrogenase [Ktedonosporobacter rubrisoli]